MIKGEEEDGSGPQTRRKRYPSFKGLAYLASANFLAKGVILLSSFIDSLFTYEMVVIYGAHLDTHILLFFQSVFAVPVFLLGILLFLGIEKESFNLVLYPSLMLLFLVLLRYGAELALIFIHWEDHPDITIALLFGIDLIAIALLLLYVYFCLASSTYRSIPPTPLDPEQQAFLRSTVSPSRKAPAPPPPPEEELPVQPPPRPPPSPKFNYKLRRGVGQIDSESPEGAMLEELDKQKQRNSAILMPELEEEEEDEGKELSPEEKEKKAKTQSLKVYETEPKRRSLLLETDLDAKDEGNKKTGDEEVKKTGDEGEAEKDGAGEEEEEDGEWEWEYEEEEEEETKKDDEKRDPSPSPQILSSSFKTTAV